MKTVELTLEQFKTVPGYTTEIPVSRWKGMIDGMLYGLNDLPNVKMNRKAWLTEGNRELLLLELEITLGNINKVVQFQLEPVIIMVKKRTTKGIPRAWKLVPEEKASWKLFHDLLERKIAGARIGITEIHHEFMSYISKQLPDGTQGTFADFMDLILEKGDLERLALEDKKIIEPQYEVRNR